MSGREINFPNDDAENPNVEAKLKGRVIELTSRLPKPVHVAILCPPGAAVTALLNKMGAHHAMFILSQGVPMQVGSLAKVNGQPNVVVYPLMVFSIDKAEFESWMKTKYSETQMYQMDDIMHDQILSEGANQIPGNN